MFLSGACTSKSPFLRSETFTKDACLQENFQTISNYYSGVVFSVSVSCSFQTLRSPHGDKSEAASSIAKLVQGEIRNRMRGWKILFGLMRLCFRNPKCICFGGAIFRVDFSKLSVNMSHAYVMSQSAAVFHSHIIIIWQSLLIIWCLDPANNTCCGTR